MSTTHLTLKLPEDLVRRLKQSVPAHRRAAFVARAIEQGLAAREVGGFGFGGGRIQGVPVDMEKLAAMYGAEQGE